MKINLKNKFQAPLTKRIALCVVFGVATFPLPALSQAGAQVEIQDKKQFDADVAFFVAQGKTPEEARAFILKVEEGRQKNEDKAIKVKIIRDSVEKDGGVSQLRYIETMIPSNRQLFYGASVPSVVESAANLLAHQETTTLIAVQNAKIIEQNEKIIALLQQIANKK